jgi:hypothetical protein
VQALKTRTGNVVTEEKKSIDGKQILRWHARQIGALPKESALPPAWYYQDGVAYYVGDPAAYYRKLNEVMLARAARNARTREVVRKLAARVKTKREAVEVIRDYVAENVRLAGPSSFTELPLSELSDADTTLLDGYGHAADRAILLHAMLTAVGVHPEFVLASDLPAVAGLAHVARSFPLPDEFHIPLIRIVADGETYYLNDTDQYARLGSTPHDDCLCIDPVTGACGTIRAAGDCHDRVATTYSLVLNDQGNARIGIKREYYGMTFDQENRRFSEMLPEERAQYFQEVVSGVTQGARAVGGLVTDFNVYPGVEQFEVDVKRYAVTKDRCFYFRLPFTPQLFPTDTNRRALPLLIPDLFDETIEARIKLPPGYRHAVIAPRSVSFTGPEGAGSARVISTRRNGNYIITYQLEQRPAVIHPADYPAAFKVESALENKAARVLLLEGGTNKPQSGNK